MTLSQNKVKRTTKESCEKTVSIEMANSKNILNATLKKMGRLDIKILFNVLMILILLFVILLRCCRS
jgi:hypothetical protein